MSHSTTVLGQEVGSLSPAEPHSGQINLEIPRTESYKNISTVDLRFAVILAIWLVDNGHVTFISQ